jgi:hypothetical protein
MRPRRFSSKLAKASSLVIRRSAVARSRRCSGNQPPNYDRPRADWYDADGRPVLKAERFDYRELLPS